MRSLWKKNAEVSCLFTVVKDLPIGLGEHEIKAAEAPLRNVLDTARVGKECQMRHVASPSRKNTVGSPLPSGAREEEAAVVLGSPEYCVAVYVDADVILTELKEAIQQKVEAIHCPAPLLQLYVLRRDNDDGDNQWLGGDDPDLDLLEMAQVPVSVLEKYVKPERLMKPRRELNFYFNDTNHFDSAAVHMLVQVPRGSETESAAECSDEVREIEITAPVPQDHKMQSVTTETLGHVRKVLQSVVDTACSGLKIGYRVAKDATLKICIKLRCVYERVLDRVVETFKSNFGIRTSPTRVKCIN